MKQQAKKIFLVLAAVFFITGISLAESIDDYYVQALDYAQKGDFLQAKTIFEKILTMCKGAMSEVVKGELKQIENIVNGRIKKETAICLFKTESYANQGLHEEALSQAKEAVNLNPDYAMAYAALGAQYNHLGFYDEAIEQLKKAINLEPGLIQAYNNMGFSYTQKKLYDEAISYLKKSIELNPNSSFVYGNLGSAYNRKGLYDEAIASFKKAIAIEPQDAGSHNNLSIAYYMKEQYKEAIYQCDKAVELGYPVSPGFLDALRQYRNKD